MNSIRSFGVSIADRVIALFLLVALWPTLLLAAFLIHVTSDGPVLIPDEVLSRDGARFRSLRFRTTGRGKPAFQALGKLYRRYSIDELPALMSVVRGNMSLRDVLKFLMPPPRK